MRSPDEATEHLKTIRSLMERATVYRAISAPTALFGGCLAIILSLLLTLRLGHASTTALSSSAWLACWLCALLAVVVFNAVLILRKCRNESQAFLSSGLRHALRATLPPMLAGGMIGITLLLNDPAQVVNTTSLWLTFYGLALLSTTSFSPKSLSILGSLILALGLINFLNFNCPACRETACACDISSVHYTIANILMGVGFGAFHIIYGLYLVISGKKDGIPETETEA